MWTQIRVSSKLPSEGFLKCNLLFNTPRDVSSVTVLSVFLLHLSFTQPGISIKPVFPVSSSESSGPSSSSRISPAATQTSWEAQVPVTSGANRNQISTALKTMEGQHNVKILLSNAACSCVVHWASTGPVHQKSCVVCRSHHSSNLLCLLSA